MLRVAFRVTLSVTALLMIFLTNSIEFANAGQLGGAGFGGGGSCSESGDVTSCTAAITGSPGDSGGGPDGAAGAITTGDSTGSGAANTSTCRYAPDPNGGPPPPGANPNGQWYWVADRGNGNCDGLTPGEPGPLANIWVPAGSPPPPPPPDPAVVGAQAASQLQLPAPSMSLSPSANAWVNFPEWLWIDSSIWHSISTSATACNSGGCTTASATATPYQVVWSFGDGGTTTCATPGTVYNHSVSANQTTDCSYTFKAASPSNSVKALVDWSVAWAGPEGSGGALPVMTSVGEGSIAVKQIESVLVKPG